jgi:FkbH-like protein
MPPFSALIEWQKVLFDARPRRLAMVSLTIPAGLDRISVRVHRNHGVELFLRPAEAYFAYAGLAPEWLVGKYDDSLAFIDLDRHRADVEFVWLDFGRYVTAEDTFGWLTDRLGRLRDLTTAPIVVANSPYDGEAANRFNAALLAWAESIPDVFVADLAPIRRELGTAFWDTRRGQFTGSVLSGSAFIAVARLVASRIVPSLWDGNIKALAVDLDNTLYGGVLGEDGVDGIVLTDDHWRLQSLLARLAEAGQLLICVSRNDPSDVQALFERRTDFPLKAGHFADWQVSWDSKVTAIGRGVARLRIGTEAVLFLEDNSGELAQVAAELPDVALVWSGEPAQAVRTLTDHPRLWLHRPASETDALRVRDLRANAEREVLLRTTASPVDYVRSLGIILDLRLNPADQVRRLSELSLKTNQFNLSLRRFSEVEVRNHLNDPDSLMAAAAMRDRLSDSGIIAALFARRIDGELVVDELCISCRALGRSVEDVIVGEILDQMLERFGLGRVRFHFVRGPRNEPALTWLAAYACRPALTESDGDVSIDWTAKRDFPWREEWNVVINWSAP